MRKPYGVWMTEFLSVFIAAIGLIQMLVGIIGGWRIAGMIDWQTGFGVAITGITTGFILLLVPTFFSLLISIEEHLRSLRGGEEIDAPTLTPEPAPQPKSISPKRGKSGVSALLPEEKKFDFLSE